MKNTGAGAGLACAGLLGNGTLTRAAGTSAQYSGAELAAYFGYFSAVVGVLAIGLQLFGTSRLLNRAGVIGSLAVLPVSLAAGDLALVLFPALWAASMAKGADTLFRYSVNEVVEGAKDGLLRVYLAGDFTESTEFGGLARRLQGRVDFDAGGVPARICRHRSANARSASPVIT